MFRYLFIFDPSFEAREVLSELQPEPDWADPAACWRYCGRKFVGRDNGTRMPL